MKVISYFALFSAITVLSAALIPRSNVDVAVCEFQPVTEFNPQLPASHVQNQCARIRDDVTEVSWFSWIAGKSPSFQFHFLDLLELLHGDDSKGDFSPSSNDA
jgi:hypothetical protein